MNIKKTLLTVAVAMGCMSMSAQETEYVFNPYWYGQFGFGFQETLGEASFGKLMAPNAQIGAGYQFNPLFGLRATLNGWQSKAALNNLLNKDYSWKWDYLALGVDGTFDLSNFVLGYKPDRLCDINIFAGIGLNYAWHNGEAENAAKAMTVATGVSNPLEYLWTGSKVRLVGRFGASCDFRLTDAWKLGLEANANVLNDHYNSKKAGNADWYFNVLVSAKYSFGTTYTTRKIEKAAPVVAPEPVIQEKIVEKIVEVPVQVVPEVQPMQRDIFFTISTTKISLWEMQKVREIAEYMKQNPNATVTVTGYADKGTGSLQLNLRLAKQRAQAVYDALTKDYGIDASRITTDSMTTAEYQPFTDPVLNRVAICVATPNN